MNFEVEEKFMLSWEKKQLVIEDKLINFYKVSDGKAMGKCLETILFSKMEIANSEGNTFTITESKRVRTFRMLSKDLKDVFFSKLSMKQEDFFNQSALSSKYNTNKKGVLKEKASKMEKAIMPFITLLPLLFQDFNAKLDQFKELIAKKKNQREIYLDLYHSFRGLLCEIKKNNDGVYTDLLAMMKEVDKSAIRRNTVYQKPSDLKSIEDEDNKSLNDSFSMSFNNDPLPKSQFSTKSFDRLQISKHDFPSFSTELNLSFSIIHFRRDSEGEKQNEKRKEGEIETERAMERKRERERAERERTSEREKTNEREREQLKTFEPDFPLQTSRFNNPLYNFNRRDKYPHHMHLPKTFISDSLISLTNKERTFPITLNEPITTLQRQCEKMIYTSYLIKADEAKTKQMKLSYISGFILSQLSLDFNRFMEPITPLKGETYEYYDNALQYRFFAEEVSSNPSISAYIGESDHFTISGDTKHSSCINIVKSSFEANYSSPVTIKLLQSNETFKCTLPLKALKFPLNLSVEYQGVICITNERSKSDYCLITIANGRVDGKVFVNESLITLLSGSLDYAVQMQNVVNKETVILWKLPKKEKYLQNRIGRKHYYMPSISYNLNHSSPSLLSSLPETDSRRREDIREYEKGNILKAQQSKNELEQRRNLQDSSRPQYFYEFNDTFIYNDNYWKKSADKP